MFTCLSEYLLASHGDIDWPQKRDEVHITMKTITHFKRITTIHLKGGTSELHMKVYSASQERRPAS